MAKTRLVGLILIGVGAGACGGSMEPTLDDQWTFHGLDGAEVHHLKAFSDDLYAGTDAGVFRKKLDASDTTWASVGLRERRIEALLPLSHDTVIASVRISGQGADTISLYRTVNGGADWLPVQNGFGSGEGSSQVGDLARVAGSARLLVTGGKSAVVAKSNEEGLWEPVWGSWERGAASMFIQTDPSWPDLVWAGGETGFLQPLLLKSNDRGDTWIEFSLTLGGDNAHYSVAIDPRDSTRVFTGTEGHVLRTEDGGATWQHVLSPPSYPYFFGLGISTVDPDRVYAGGAINTLERQNLMLFISRDAGSSWMTVTYEGLRPGGVRDVLVFHDGGSDEVYVGSGSGVYSITVPD